MIDSISGATEAPAPSPAFVAPAAPASPAASINATLSVGQTQTVYAGTWEAATRHAAETSANPSTTSGKSTMLHARSMDAVEDVVIRNLLDSLSPSSRIAGSFFLADGEEPAPRSLIATYYDDV